MRPTRWYVAVLAAALALGGCSGTDDVTEPRMTLPPPTGRVVSPSPAALAAAESTPVEDPYYPGTSNPEVDALHYNLALQWDGILLIGRATIVLRSMASTGTLRLDLSPDLQASAASVDGAPVPYRQAGGGIVLTVGRLPVGSSHTVVVDYAGRPLPVPAPSGRSDMQEGLGWSLDDDGNVYTFQEPYGASTWYPVNDHPSDKALYDVQVTVPRGQTAVVNGALRSSGAAGPDATTWRWHLAEPAASYLMTIAIGPYTAVHQTLPGGTPATYWLLPQDRGLADTLRSQTPEAFRWLVRHAGPYPFATFGVVVVGGNSGMETQTMVTLSRGSFDRQDAVLEHEIAHQWFGDAVTPTDWQGLWLNEGWAMYLQQAFEDETGRYEYGGGLTQWRPLDIAARARSGPPGDFRPEAFGDVNVYLGPAMMLDEIRQRVGDAAFVALTTAWVKDHDNVNVDRAEFVRWLNASTGDDFTGLVDRWLDSPITPR